ncbi:MarC family protein, partial [Methanothrix sp.]
MESGNYLLYFVYVFSSVFVIVNPIEASMVYVSLTAGMNPLEKSRIYRRATLVAFIIAI